MDIETFQQALKIFLRELPDVAGIVTPSNSISEFAIVFTDGTRFHILIRTGEEYDLARELDWL